MSERKIAYEKHPVSAERKAELRKQGFKIIDARFASSDQSEAEAEPLEDTATDQTDAMGNLRAEYERVLSKKPFMGWDADELRKRMAEAGE